MSTSDPAAESQSADLAQSEQASAPPGVKPLSPAAARALAEATARRAEIDRKTAERPTEFNGRGGLEPARYGDWEVKGIASDF